MRYQSYIILLLLVTVFSAGCTNEKKLHSRLEKMADDLNLSAPAQLDDHTVFTGADVTNDNIFRYHYRIVNSPNPDSLIREMEKQTFANIREAFRLNPDLQIFTLNEVEIEYIYTDSTGKTLTSIPITPGDYK